MSMNFDFMNLKTIIVTALAIFTVVSEAKENTGKSLDAPNIIIILADDLGFGDVRSYTKKPHAPINSAVKTSAIDKLAKGGVRFTNAHSSSVCTPTRYELLTGRYAWRTQLKGVLGGYSPVLIKPGQVSLAELARENGYKTALIGKWHLGMNWVTTDGEAPSRDGNNVDHDKPFTGGPIDHGFDEFFGISMINSPPFAYLENDRSMGTPSVPIYQIPSYQNKRQFGLKTPDYNHEGVMPTLVRKAAAYIKENAGGETPFFLYFPLTAPHGPIAPPDHVSADKTLYITAYDKDERLTDYDNFIRLVDWSVEQVENALKANGLSDNTIVIFSSDNGVSKVTASHDHISPGFVKGVLLKGQKGDVYEGGHRVPLIVRWPGEFKRGKVSDVLVELNDLYATIADLLNVPTKDGEAEDSVSFAPALLDTTINPTEAPRRIGVNTSFNGGFSIREIDEEGREWKLIFGSHAAGGFSGGMPIDPFEIIDDQSIFHWALQLYELTTDPGESYDLLQDRGVSEEEFQRVLGMQTRLQEIIRSDESRVGIIHTDNKMKETSQ